MTFYEAALEVLRQSGRPLHFKKITELAIRENLLSHVGKTPEITMSSRLSQEVKREEFSALKQTRPGIFKLKEEIAEKLNKEAEERDKLAAEEESRRADEPDDEPDLLGEDDDDQPDDDEQDETEEYSSNRSRSRRGGRRSRRGGRRSRHTSRRQQPSEEEQEEQQDDAQDKEESESRSSRGNRRGGRRRSRRSREDRSSKRDRDEPAAKDEGDKDDESSSSKRSSRRPSSRSHHSKRRADDRQGSRRPSRRSPQEDAQDTEQKHLEDGPVRLEGLAEAAYTVLQDFDEIADIEEIATAIFKRKLVKFHTHDPSLTVQSALVNDNQLRMRRGHRELFVRHSNKRWGLSEWGLTVQTLQKEQQILSLSEECRQEALRKLGKTLLKVKTEALEQVTLTMLEGLGYRNIKVSKRSSNGDVFFSADWRQGLSDMRVCIQLIGDSTEELVQDAVTALRGTLHHYSAHEGLIIHFGDINKKAVEESREEKLANITLIDRKTFVELLVDQGIGVKRYHTPILVVDNAYIEELTN